jgi:hypothetical protein
MPYSNGNADMLFVNKAMQPVLQAAANTGCYTAARLSFFLTTVRTPLIGRVQTIVINRKTGSGFR